MSVSLTMYQAQDTARTCNTASVQPLATLRTWIDRTRQRRTLRALDDHLLGDIGISRSDAEAEAAKPFWKA